MSDWTAGYVADIGYTFGYYTELNPIRAKLALLHKGFAVPEFSTACELGFGQGVSVNFHATGSSTRWYGSDFNPSQAANAVEMAAVSGNQAVLTDESFELFCKRSDLPEFDFIGLHGIWSWISDENRSTLVDFISRKLKVGGVLYVSYNTMPGWASFAPLRYLMTEHAEIIGSEGRGIINRIDDALEFADKLLATNPLFLKANPQLAERVKALKGQNRNYLAHEYFNRDWHPMPFAKMADWLEPAKMQYACSANYLDHIDALHLTAEQQKFLAEIPDVMFRESVRDFMINQQFRRDYWVKGLRKLTQLEQLEARAKERVVLITRVEDIKLKVQGSLGELDLNADVYSPVLKALANYKPVTIGELQTRLTTATVSADQIFQAVMILIGSGQVASCYDDASVKQNKDKVGKLNDYIFNKSRAGGDIAYAVSPLTGGGIGLGRFNQLFIRAINEGKTTPAQWAEYAWNVLALTNQRIVKEGVTLTIPEENLAELQMQAKTFETNALPIMRSLKIV